MACSMSLRRREETEVHIPVAPLVTRSNNKILYIPFSTALSTTLNKEYREERYAYYEALLRNTMAPTAHAGLGVRRDAVDGEESDESQ